MVSIPGRLHEVQRYYLEDVLRLTGYRSRRMVLAEQELRRARANGHTYWNYLEGAHHVTRLRYICDS